MNDHPLHNQCWETNYPQRESNPGRRGFMLVCYDPARLLALVAEWLSEQQRLLRRGRDHSSDEDEDETTPPRRSLLGDLLPWSRLLVLLECVQIFPLGQNILECVDPSDLDAPPVIDRWCVQRMRHRSAVLRWMHFGVSGYRVLKVSEVVGLENVATLPRTVVLLL